MRRLRRRTELADFTWQKPPRLKWRLKFFASICLFAFMTGLMLGQLINGRPDGLARLQSIEQLEDGLQLCFDRAIGVAEVSGQGLYGLYLQGVRLEPAGGRLLLEGQQVSWALLADTPQARLSFTALHPLRGQWRENSQGCLRLKLLLDAAVE